MPEQKPIPGQKPQAAPAPQSKGQAPPPEAQPPAPEKKAPAKKTPAQEKDESLKYEMTYVNGGFNNGVQMKPDKKGKALVEISIYGGGQKKTLSVGPLPAEIAKLVKAYEVSATQGQSTPEITGELQKFFQEKTQQLSSKVIQILSEADAKVAQAIKQIFKEQ